MQRIMTKFFLFKQDDPSAAHKLLGGYYDFRFTIIARIVTKLDVHLENGQRIYFTLENEVNILQPPARSILLGFLNSTKKKHLRLIV